MNDEVQIDYEGVRAILAESDRIQAKKCCMEHPFWKVLCQRAIGHPRDHWFAVQWTDANDAAQTVRRALRRTVEGA